MYIINLDCNKAASDFTYINGRMYKAIEDRTRIFQNGDRFCHNRMGAELVTRMDTIGAYEALEKLGK